ncbi:mannose-P-dolichol utilization defect 1 protein-like [Mya arenaria]|uniref:mannose-P-dolichol utilization defect 1 protein-like n=1 Tax=Mya arenaria TaxID=6604 RepID=UPI0022E30169|nr:mannose-P-dolichol utilization defect 1 protein-like [Mya arenaria]
MKFINIYNDEIYDKWQFLREKVMELYANVESVTSVCGASCLVTALGYVLIGTMTISQVPQIFKILRKRSVLGVSFYSMLLLLHASSATVAHALLNGFPISAWGEHIVLLQAYVVLVCLMLRYNDRSLAAVAFMIAYVAFMSLLLLPSVPPRLVWILHFLSLPAVALSRLLQIYKIYRTKSPGQLSATSAFLCIFQGVGRLATSALSTGDVIMTLTFTVASLLNVLLFVQVMVYRRRLKKAS